MISLQQCKVLTSGFDYSVIPLPCYVAYYLDDQSQMIIMFLFHLCVWLSLHHTYMCVFI